MPHRALKDCIIVTAGTGEHDWTNASLATWITEASGRFDRTLSDATTHLAITKKLWLAAGPLVQDALKRRAKGQKLMIVGQDWLMESLQEKCRKKEKGYWLLMPERSSDDGGAGGGGGAGGPRSHGGLLKELYLETTELTPTQKRLNEKKAAMEEAVRKENAAQKEKELQKHIQASMTMPELASIFKKGSQKAKKILLNDCYHTYQDPTGFHYDITLTKVDTAKNTNEIYNLVLQIFESNVEPHNYAFSTSFSGTKVVQTDNVVVAIGSNFPTAMRVFRNCFKEKTGMEWADRIKVAKARAAREQEIKKAKKMGVPVSGQSGPKSIEDFQQQKFQYYPPSYGPVGETGTPPPQVQEVVEPQDEEQDFMMSGGNGEAATAAPRAETPVRPEFGPEDLDKFMEAQIVENEDGEKLDPMAAPFPFGETVVEEAAEAPEQEQQQAAYASPPPEPESSVLGKRKDSPVGSSGGEAKKQKTGQQVDPEDGDYIMTDDEE